MRDVFEYFNNHGGYHHKDFVSFGSVDRDINQYYVWETQYDIWKGQFSVPTVYYNMFKYFGKPVIQYWFFYPFNLWANDHEGDWEHINVRVSTPDPTRAYLEEVIFYFHEHRKSLPHDAPQLHIENDTHPVVYVGGHAIAYFHADNSGGSYWQAGVFPDVGINLIDESITVNQYSAVVRWEDFDRIWAGNAKLNENAWWLEFPGFWGRRNYHLTGIQSPPHWLNNAPNGPWRHECWEQYQYYNEYESRDGGPVAAAPSPGGAGDPAPPTDAEPYGPPVAADAPSPTAGDRVSPSAGDRPSPVAVAPKGGADVPGADLPPDSGPVLTSPTNAGGDSLSPGAAVAPFELREPLAAAASASPLACSPNPVTATATISFKLGAPSRVHLAVYDLSGRRVATLAEGSFGAGDHAASWRADVPTGVYIYRLQAGDRVAVKKVVVAK
jgi:hypothetical protein